MSVTVESENGIPAAERDRRIASPAGQRLVAAARESIRERGVAGTTFDRIGPEARVSRGSIAWYFGTKERLLAEVLRSDSDRRLVRMRERLEPVASSEEMIVAFGDLLGEFLDESRGPQIVLGEMASLALRHETIRMAQTELRRRWRRELARVLEEKVEQGVILLPGSAEGTASLLTALAQGMAIETISDPDWDVREAIEQAAVAARALLGGARSGVA
jgi:AcrR family transcriptional regulator